MRGNVVEAFTHLVSLFNPHLECAELWVEVRAFRPRGRSGPVYRTFFPAKISGLADAATVSADLARDYETYAGMLPRDGHGGRRENVPIAARLWADVDGGEEGVAGAERLLERACRDKGLPPPDLLVASGGGLHPSWSLADVVPLPTDRQRQEYASVLRRVALLIGGTAPGAHADVSVAEVARVLRVAGTYNRKRVAPRPVVLLKHPPLTNPAPAAQTLLWWRAFLPALPLPAAPKLGRGRGRRPATTEHGLPLEAVRLLTEPVPLGGRHPAALRLIAIVQRSGSPDWLLDAVAREFADLNAFPDDEMERILEWAKENVSADQQEEVRP